MPLRLAGNVLGAGLFLVVPVVAALAGPWAPLAWLLTLGTGALFSLLLVWYAGQLGRTGSIAELAGTGWGQRGERVVLAIYLAGFVIGQAAIVVCAGHLLAVAFGVPDLGYLFGAGVLAAALIGALAGLSLSETGRRWRLAATAAVTVFGSLQPALFAAGGLLPDRDWLGGALFVVLFAGVGWESSGRLGLTGRDVWWGAGLVLLGYLVPAVLLGARLPAGSLSTPVRIVAVVAAAVLASYVLTNLTAAAGFVTALGGPRALPAVGVAAGAVLAVAAVAGWGAAGLLAGPSVATWLGYLVASSVVLAGGVGHARRLAVVVVSCLIALGITPWLMWFAPLHSG